MKRVILGLLLMLGVINVQAQKATPSQIINAYMHFLNESTHGLLIVHELMEIENQEINKYVDLDSYNYSSISNQSVSENVFTEQDFYIKKNPFEWLAFANKLGKQALPEKNQTWNKRALEIKKVLNDINQIRFDIEKYINTHDLNDQVSILGAYEYLENTKSLFDKYYILQADFYSDLKKFYKSKGIIAKKLYLVNAMYGLHHASKSISDALRFKNDNSFQDLILKLEGAYANFKKAEKKLITSPDFDKSLVRHLKKINKKTKAVMLSAKEFYDTANVPKEFKQYGKYYHYNNNVIIPLMNRYGGGFVSEMNVVVNSLDLGAINYLELPQFYQVIYPEKIDSSDQIESTDPMIAEVPKKLKNRKIKVSDHVIIADKDILEVELFDHMIQDGDIVSINFNGDWLLEKYSIEAKPKVLTLKLNKKGKNYLLLHADSEGRRPPNTMGIKYLLNGKVEQIILKSNLKESAMIEIRQTKK